MNDNKEKVRNFPIKKWHLVTAMLMAYDALAVVAAYFLGLWIRFDCKYSHINKLYLAAYFKFIPYYAVGCIIVFFI